MSWAATAAIAVLALGVPLAVLDLRRAVLLAQIAGVALLLLAGVLVLADGGTVGAGFRSAIDPAFGVDALSAFFLVVIAAAAVPALLYAHDALAASPVRRPLDALAAVFVLALVGVVTARDPSTFLCFWELMTVIPATALLVARRDAVARHVAFVYLAVTHIGGAGVWVSILTLAHHDAFGARMDAAGPQTLVLVAALVGFGTKAGLVPLHAWLPRAHPVAPSQFSALMSGVMLKVALYGLLRVVFEWAAPAPRWFGLTLLALGALSALIGVLYALVQPELKRLLAFSSVENVGIITLALGASVVLAADGETRWAAIAFGAGLLHMANHAAFKSLLFLAAGAFAHATHSLAFADLGGLLRRMPWTGGAFLVGCLAAAGLPPLNGFTSEWLTLQSLLHVGYSPVAGISLAGGLASAALAITAALAVYCFVKVAGLVLLGGARGERAATATEQPFLTRAALAVAAASCIALAACVGFLLPVLVDLAPGDATVPSAVATVDLPQTGGFPALPLLLVLPALVLGLARLARRGPRAAPAPAWACGQRVEPSLDWTSAGFTKPLRLVLQPVLRPDRDLTIRESHGIATLVRHRSEVRPLFDRILYTPLTDGALRVAGGARRLQSGSLQAYLAYLVVLILTLLAAVRWGVLT